MNRILTESFDRVEDIPDPVDPSFLLPADEPGLFAPFGEDMDINTAVPAVEFAYVYLDAGKPGGSEFLLQMLEVGEPSDLHYMIRDLMGNHMNRAIARVVLHPDRYQLFDLAKVYDNEIKLRSVRANPENERPFFKHFIEYWGVLNRDSIEEIPQTEGLHSFTTEEANEMAASRPSFHTNLSERELEDLEDDPDSFERYGENPNSAYARLVSMGYTPDTWDTILKRTGSSHEARALMIIAKGNLTRKLNVLYMNLRKLEGNDVDDVWRPDLLPPAQG